MRIEPPAPGEPRRPFGPRNPGDAWVTAPDGERYWGRFGAAGLLALDPGRGVLLQHRVSWSHHGDTWALPGGARHEHETALAAALRESAEEAGVPSASVRSRLTDVLDLGIWSYTTVVADVIEPFEPVISDPESRELAWVLPDDVAGLPLHPGFASSWEKLRRLLGVRPAVVIDAANVVGSVPDGWWKDRPAAARRLLDAATALGARGVPADALDLPGHTWFPEVTVVLEGEARAAADVPGAPALTVRRAEAAGDDAILAAAVGLAALGRSVTVATSDRELAARCRAAGARIMGAGSMRELLRY